MSLRQIDESFHRSQNEETECLFHSSTDDAEVFVSPEETKSFCKEDVLAGYDKKTVRYERNVT